MTQESIKILSQSGLLILRTRTICLLNIIKFNPSTTYFYIVHIADLKSLSLP